MVSLLQRLDFISDLTSVDRRTTLAVERICAGSGGKHHDSLHGIVMPYEDVLR